MITTKEELIVKLRSINACESAIDYIDGQPDLQTAWENCRPSYLWWLVRHTVKLTPQQSVEFAKVSAVYAKFVAERAAERAAEWAAEGAAEWAAGAAGRAERGVEGVADGYDERYEECDDARVQAGEELG